jgi:Lecithin retinol acyltransferase
MERSQTEKPARYRQVEHPGAAGEPDLPSGCWLVTPRRGYTHHGIYVGDGRVVHYAGLSRSWRRGPIELVSLEEFRGRRGLWAKPTPGARYIGRPAVRRALSRLGENRYRILTNNCEHFCTWCLDGESRSAQIEQWLAWPRSVAETTLAWLSQVLNPSPLALTASQH